MCELTPDEWPHALARYDARADLILCVTCGLIVCCPHGRWAVPCCGAAYEDTPDNRVVEAFGEFPRGRYTTCPRACDPPDNAEQPPIRTAVAAPTNGQVGED